MSLTPQSRVVVVGGTSGIGLAVAQAALKRGAQVVVGSRLQQSVDEALARLQTASGRPVDVTDPTSLASFFLEAGEFDHLVYTAGDDLARAVIADYTPDQGHAFFDIRLFRALDTVRAALPTLHRDGSILLTSGAAAYRGGAGRLLGSAVSGAVISAGRSLAVELAPVRVNVVAPAVVSTPLWAAMPAAAREQLFEHAGGATLVGRVAAAEDVALAYVHLMEQDCTTGTVALLDGGSTLV